MNELKKPSIFLFLILLFFWAGGIQSVTAQETSHQNKTTKTTTHRKKKKKPLPRDPKKATLMALVPGLGQIYNHKYWKLPIVYTGFGVIGYFVVTNTQYYQDFKDAYNCKVTDPDCKNPLAEKYSEETLKYIRDYYRRNMQLSYIIGGAWYLLQLIDANVDAHLSHWNVSDDLSLDISPVYHPVPVRNQPAWQGICLRLKF
ncbi:DUF5683 domain-containing protein [Candidatus Sulfidibacterium hydrothermale]|uniref:DUF5683 domain-containing protein n=1 Tax=Candidatus Sulfidibacterium hydrothermale TaxID=2875962 RepID=UPI001F0A5CBD|nr:DUF5683 domain-containing protein [Candidatus Sulfidibacterium hydrothermale]UBM63471.1 DUF5683 domain-containing protein [Candidatus Sulfidibacterium hydrothermale]